jgi:hypothetical protein
MAAATQMPVMPASIYTHSHKCKRARKAFRLSPVAAGCLRLSPVVELLSPVVAALLVTKKLLSCRDISQPSLASGMPQSPV